MRFLKWLIISIVIFLGAFTVACFTAWCITGSEPVALISGVYGAGLSELLAGVAIKIAEIISEKITKKREAKKLDEQNENTVPQQDGEINSRGE